MRVDRSQLLQVLESVRAGLTARDVTEQSSCFAFSGGTVMTFNDEVACRRTCDLAIEGAVQAAPLLQLLSRLPEDHVEISVEDGELIIKGKRRRAGLRMSAEVTMPIETVETAEAWKRLHEEFSDAVHVAHQCCGKDEANYTSTCINITRKWIEACDNHQAVRYRLKTQVAESFLVRGASLKHIVSLNMTEFAETDAWVHFRNPTGLVLSCRRDVQAYEPLDSLLTGDGTKLVIPKGLAEAAAKAEIFSAENADDNEVTVEIKPGAIVLSGQGVSGWYRETRKTKYRGEPLTFTVAPKLLSDLVKRFTECVVCPGKLLVDGGKFMYVVALGQKADLGGDVAADEIPF